MAVKSVAAQMVAAGAGLDGEAMAFLLLKNLKPEYRHLRQLIERTSVKKVNGQPTLVFEDVCAQLLRESQMEQVEGASAAALRVLSPCQHRISPQSSKRWLRVL